MRDVEESETTGHQAQYLAMAQEPCGYQTRQILRHRGNIVGSASDDVGEEVPLAIVVNGISHVVMMVTPLDLEAFALGFALSEGIVTSRDQVYDLEVRRHPRAMEVELTIAAPMFQRMKAQRRTLAGRTGCGVCGIESLALLDLAPELMPGRRLPTNLGQALERAAGELPTHQVLTRRTGGLHAAAWCNLDGKIIRVFEDVGRHNALDKLLGHAARAGIDLRQGFVFLSSRASYELVRKAIRMHVPMLATISAPSTLAIDIATKGGLKLVSFCRLNSFAEYT
jgi:FdhD protein